MSLEYRNDEPQTTEVENETENYQRAALVTPVYSIILIACLVAVFLCQSKVDGIEFFIYGGGISGLLAGFSKQLFLEGQYWRILTGSALHSGLLHLLFNAYALYVLGKLIETISSRSHLAIVFLLSAIGGSVLSLIFIPEGISVGASGGVVGFLGYLTIYGFKRRKLLPKGFLNNMLFNVAFIAFTGIVLNQSSSEIKIDNFGHLGGLLVGATYGLIQIPSDLYKDPRVVNPATKFFGYAALGIFILTAVFAMLVLLGIITIQIPANFFN